MNHAHGKTRSREMVYRYRQVEKLPGGRSTGNDMRLGTRHCLVARSTPVDGCVPVRSIASFPTELPRAVFCQPASGETK